MTGEQATEDAIRLTLTVQALAERAFAVFAEGLASWYPSEYTWSQDVLDTIAIEGREGGRCFERGPGGSWIDWAGARLGPTASASFLLADQPRAPADSGPGQGQRGRRFRTFLQALLAGISGQISGQRHEAASQAKT
jgi:hypothetical protein